MRPDATWRRLGRPRALRDWDSLATDHGPACKGRPAIDAFPQPPPPFDTSRTFRSSIPAGSRRVPGESTSKSPKGLATHHRYPLSFPPAQMVAGVGFEPTTFGL